MMYYTISETDRNEVGFVMSDEDLISGAVIVSDGITHIIVGYSTEDVIGYGIEFNSSEISAVIADIYAEDGWRIFTPVKISSYSELKALYKQCQFAELTKYAK